MKSHPMQWHLQLVTFPLKPYQQLGKILFKVKPQPILSNFMLIINSQLPGLPANQMCNIQYKHENQSPFEHLGIKIQLC